MKKYSILPWIVAIMALVSCNITEDIPCQNGYIRMVLTGFAVSDLDSAFVIRYTPGQSFSNVVDTLKTAISERGKDTIHCYTRLFAAKTPVNYDDGALGVKYDYRLCLPRLGRWYDIADITLIGKTHERITYRKGKRDEYDCDNPAVSCTVNNVRVTTTYSSGALSYLYIGK
ncbi:MAG: hypothetical protein KF744_04680 [Taibaiella sp.]|nr:hypothetical protein [Taibaiella sp.]